MLGVFHALDMCIASLGPSAGQTDAVSRACAHLQRRVAPRLSETSTLLVGAYGRQTAIWPVPGVDVLVTLPDKPGSPASALAYLQRILTTAACPRPIVEGHAVQYHVSDVDIILSVTPAVPEADVYRVPSCRDDTWIRVCPERHHQIFTAAHEASGHKLRPLIQALRRWNCLQGEPLRGLHLEVMAWSALPVDPGSSLEGLVILLDSLAGQVAQPCPDPAGVGPNIDGRLDRSARAEARRRLTEAARLARVAWYAAARDDAPAADAALRALFGNAYPISG